MLASATSATSLKNPVRFEYSAAFEFAIASASEAISYFGSVLTLNSHR